MIRGTGPRRRWCARSRTAATARCSGTPTGWPPCPAACGSTRGPSAGRAGGWGGRAKNKARRAAERDEAAVAAARRDRPAALAGIDPARLVFIDGGAALTDRVRTDARSPRGERARAAVPHGRWRRLTVIGALGPGGTAGAMTIEAATSGAVFAAFLDRVPLPERRATEPDAVLVLVMDNLAAHRTRAVRDLLERSGFAYRYLPPSSPDLNPIEPARAEVKARLRAAAARTAEALHDAVAVGGALAAVTPGDAAGFFRHAGYTAV